MSVESLSFADMGLPEPVLAAVRDVGYEVPSPIQAQAIPVLLQGRDLIGMAQTGTGKTAAFALPALARCDVHRRGVQILVLAPTRELAIQVSEAFQTYASHLPDFHVLPIYGGQDYRTQFRGLQRGAQVVVGTPGRILDHIDRGSLELGGVNMVVLDEADEMLRMGFIDDVRTILDKTATEKQVALFSATMPPAIARVAQEYLREPVEVRIKTETKTVANIEQKYWLVKGTNKLDAITRLLDVEDYDGVVVFVRTKNSTVELADKLNARGHMAGAINGDMNQQARERMIDRLKSGSIDILVATDVAARGIDVPRVTHVINYDMPYDNEAYVHRIGRTGRAGRAGKAILFVAPRERYLLSSLEKSIKQKIEPWVLPSRDEVMLSKRRELMESIVEYRAANTLDGAAALIDELRAQQGWNLEETAQVLASMVQNAHPGYAMLAALPPESQRDDRPQRSERFERGDRPERGERFERSEKRFESEGREPRERRDPHQPSVVMDEDGNAIRLVRYRIHVGKEHGVSPRDIVGALANEAGLDSKYIGDIRLFDGDSLVEMPPDMPEDVFAHLQTVRVCGQPLRIEVAGKGTERKTEKRFAKGEQRSSGRPAKRFDDDKRPGKRRGNYSNPPRDFSERGPRDYSERKRDFGDRKRDSADRAPRAKRGRHDADEYSRQLSEGYAREGRGERDTSERPRRAPRRGEGGFAEKPRRSPRSSEGSFGDRPRRPSRRDEGGFSDKPRRSAPRDESGRADERIERKKPLGMKKSGEGRSEPRVAKDRSVKVRSAGKDEGFRKPTKRGAKTDDGFRGGKRDFKSGGKPGPKRARDGSAPPRKRRDD